MGSRLRDGVVIRHSERRELSARSYFGGEVWSLLFGADPSLLSW